MAPRKQPKSLQTAQDAQTECKLTSADEIHVTSNGFLVNGVLRPNLDNCELGAGVTFIAQYDELIDADTAQDAKKVNKANKANKVRKIEHAPSMDTASKDAVTLVGWEKDIETEQSAPMAQQIKLPAELAELQELIDVYQDAQGAGPYVAIAVVGAYLYRKFRSNEQKNVCARCGAQQHQVQHQVQHQQVQHQVQHQQHQVQHQQHQVQHQQHQVQQQAPQGHQSHQSQQCMCPECVARMPVAHRTPTMSVPVDAIIPNETTTTMET